MRLENNLSIKSRLQQYEQLGFSSLELEEIESGLYSGVDVSLYAIADSIIGKWMRFDAA